jgi:hypothetical protein
MRPWAGFRAPQRSRIDAAHEIRAEPTLRAPQRSNIDAAHEIKQPRPLTQPQFAEPAADRDRPDRRA